MYNIYSISMYHTYIYFIFYILYICYNNYLSFDITIVCGCGDDLHTGHDPHNHTDASNMYNEDGADEARYSSFGRTFYNIGYRRRGTFRDLDVLAVHPAGKEDPTMLGMLGTECLRRTKVVTVSTTILHV